MAVLRKRRSGTKNSHYEGIGGGKRGQDGRERRVSWSAIS